MSMNKRLKLITKKFFKGIKPRKFPRFSEDPKMQKIVEKIMIKYEAVFKKLAKS